MTSVFVNGVGTSLFGKQNEVKIEALVERAVTEARDAAGRPTIEAVYFGSVYGDMGVAQRSLHRLGLHGIPIIRVENACASASTAFHEADAAVRFGRFTSVLAVGAEHMTSKFRGPIEPGDADLEARTGLPLPGIYALAASRYLACHGLREEDMASVAVKNRENALSNERIIRKSAVDLQAVVESRMICDPLTLLQCSAVSDGAAAAVISSQQHSPEDVRVRSSVLGSGKLWDARSEHVWGFDLVAETAAAAFESASITVEDADVFEVHDAFTIGEIVSTEALGLAPLGGGGELATSGMTSVGGRHPVNASGGLLGRGHPIGATGLAQVAEIVWQLQGRGAASHSDRPRIGVVETMGGGVSGIDGNACVVSVFEGPTS